MTQPPQIVDLYPDGNVSDIAAMLRGAAIAVEGETDEHDRTEAFIGVRLYESGDIHVYAWGRSDSLKAIGVLQLGATYLANEMLD